MTEERAWTTPAAEAPLALTALNSTSWRTPWTRSVKVCASAMAELKSETGNWNLQGWMTLAPLAARMALAVRAWSSSCWWDSQSLGSEETGGGTYSNDGGQRVQGVLSDARGELIAMNVVGDVGDEVGEVSNLEDLVECNEAEAVDSLGVEACWGAFVAQRATGYDLYLLCRGVVRLESGEAIGEREGERCSSGKAGAESEDLGWGKHVA